jgi:hypothetical protein
MEGWAFGLRKAAGLVTTYSLENLNSEKSLVFCVIGTLLLTLQKKQKL